MTVLYVIIAVVFVFILVCLFLVFPRAPKKESREAIRKVLFAHRGLFDNFRQLPENSQPAFSRALSKGYGIELDIQLSSDGQVVVFHDDNTKRMTQSDLVIEQTPYSDLNKLRLLDTDERIPLFKDVLDIVGGKVPLVIELKHTKNYPELCRQTMDLLNTYNGWYCIESFDPKILKWFRLNAGHILRGQLSGVATKFNTDIKNPLLRFALTNLFLNFYSRPHFIAYELENSSRPMVRLQKLLGAMLIAYTAKDLETVHKFRDCFDSIIFEDIPLPKHDKR